MELGRENERKGRTEGSKGNMTVAEAGQKGGEKTAETHGREFYQEIGHEGGQRVKELIEEGKQAEGPQGSRSGSSGSDSTRSGSSRSDSSRSGSSGSDSSSKGSSSGKKDNR